MLSSLATLLESLERRKKALVAELSGLPSEKVNYRPDADTWSMIEIADHLAKTEAAFNSAAARVRSLGGCKVTLKETVAAYGVWLVMRSPLRVKTPAAASVVLPQANLTLPEVTARWAAVREEMARVAESISVEQQRIGIFRHPVSGSLNIAQGLRFLDAHFRHHEYQLNRLREANPTRQTAR